MDSLMLGAVAYDPKVVTIWEGFRAWFAERDVDFDFVLYSNYEAQVAAHFAGHFDVAWNSPLAWIQSERIAAATGRTAQAVCMRDTDQDLTSVIVVRADSDIQTLADLKGRTIAVGAADSPLEDALIDILTTHLEDFEADAHLTSKPSSKGTFVSFTAQVVMRNREQVEAIYKALNECPHVKMTI